MIIERINDFDENLIRNLFEKIDTPSDPNALFFKTDKNILLVARQGNIIAGFLYAYILESPEMKKPRAFLYSIDVFAEFRRKRYGSALLEKLLKICRDVNCSELFVMTEPQNIPAMEFYRYHNGKRENDEEAMFVFQL